MQPVSHMWAATQPICGQSAYITPAVSEVPNAECGDMCQKCLPSPNGAELASYIPSAGSRVYDAQRADKNQKRLPSPQWGKVVILPLPSQGCPTLDAATRIKNGYLAHMWAKWLHHTCLLGGSPTLHEGTRITYGYRARMWATWLHHPCHLGGSQRFVQGQESGTATKPTSGQHGYITPAISGVPNALRGDEN